MWKNNIGIDACAMDRIKIDDRDFLKRFLHPKEYEYFINIKLEDRKREFAAGRWAVKEAMFKANNFTENFADILVGNFGGKPEVLEPESLREYAVSITHDMGFALAMSIYNGKM